MQTLSNVESRRVSELVAAFEDRQITLNELQECLSPVSSETLQVVATFGAVRDAFEPRIMRLHSARPLIRSLASVARCRC